MRHSFFKGRNNSLFSRKSRVAPSGPGKAISTFGAGWGIRAKYQPTGVANAGDIAVRAFRRRTKNRLLLADRDFFNNQLRKLQAGYKSANTLNRFEVDRTLGTGSFGRVLMVRPTKVAKGEADMTNTFMALKIIAKKRVLDTNQVEHTVTEKNILFCMENNFIVKMFDYFLDAKSIYFLLEFINGGEMFTHIHKQKRRRFSPEQTRFFAAETVLAFEYLHNLDIMFRDLKPENMLIDCHGHIRVTDFGFAKRVTDITWTMCGTPEYLAPEIIMNKGYGHGVDWWAVGVLIYEMRCGRSPFECSDQVKLFKKITLRDFTFPRDFTNDEKMLIKGLLQPDITRRLGCMHGGVDDIKNQQYFKAVHWNDLYEMKVASPYVPRVSGANDCSNFDSYPETEVTWQAGKDRFGAQFAGF